MTVQPYNYHGTPFDYVKKYLAFKQLYRSMHTMSFVLNEWVEVEDDPTTTHLKIVGVYSVTALVHTVDVPLLRLRSWCYEQAKGNVYTMDASMKLSETLGVTSPRIYLWKYIVYLRTSRIAKAWKRTALLDYRFNHGSIQYIDSVSVPSIAGA